MRARCDLPNDGETKAAQVLGNRRILFVSGKGGVGRTTLSAAIAMAAGRAGKRTLLTEMGDPSLDYSPLARIFGLDQFTEDPQEIGANLSACYLFARRGHERFLRFVLRIPALSKAAMNSGALRRFFSAAPALNELGVFYHLLTLLRARDADGGLLYEVIVFDMPATGHSLALAAVPDRVLSLMPVGPIAEAMREGQAITNDPAQSACWVVTLPEVLPVTESLELIAGMREDGIPVGGVLVNKVLQDDFSAEERLALEQMLEGRELFGTVRATGVAQVQRSLERLEREAGLPLVQLPERAEVGPELCEALVAELLAEPEVQA